MARSSGHAGNTMRAPRPAAVAAAFVLVVTLSSALQVGPATAQVVDTPTPPAGTPSRAIQPPWRNSLGPHRTCALSARKGPPAIPMLGAPGPK